MIVGDSMNQHFSLSLRSMSWMNHSSGTNDVLNYFTDHHHHHHNHYHHYHHHHRLSVLKLSRQVTNKKRVFHNTTRYILTLQILVKITQCRHHYQFCHHQ
jgi:hypothetical protein